MKNLTLTGETRAIQRQLAPRQQPWLPGFLAVMTVFWAAVPPARAQAEMQMVSDTMIEIRGAGWRLRYGTLSRTNQYKTFFTTAPGNRAWFGHARWLRMIDTKKGIVIGRWHLPGQILNVTPAGDRYEVEFEVDEGFPNDAGRMQYPMKILFDPNAPEIPFWPRGTLVLYRVPLQEIEQPLSGLAAGPAGIPAWAKLNLESARKAIPIYEEMVRRDPLSPSLRVGLGKLLQDAGDPRAGSVFREALEVRTTDYTELFQISHALERLGDREAARMAFEHAYRDFWERGNDPRLMIALIPRLILLVRPVWKPDETPPEEVRREVLERTYLLSPHAEWSEMVWKIYAEYLERKGKPDEAAVWHARAEDARQNSLYVPSTDYIARIDDLLWIVPAGFLACLFFLAIFSLRYRPQRRLDLAAGRRPPFFNLAYWSRRERYAFASVALAVWIGTGVVNCGLEVFLRFAALPLSTAAGSYAGPASQGVFQKLLPGTPERDLLLAIAYQQSRENGKAEALYRRLPQFAESWNNLGVLLKNAGKEAEARQAFERALQMQPALAEAELNLGRPPRTLWTELHKKYLAGQPMLAPPRRAQMVRAFSGGSPYRVVYRSLAGPFAGKRLENLLGVANADPPMKILARILTAFPVIALVLALAILFVVPSRPVTQPPGRWHSIWEVVFPGTSPAWGVLGGMALLGWCYYLAQLAIVWKTNTPRILMAIIMPNILRSFGVPWEGSGWELFRYLGPSWAWLLVPPALLFVVNLVVVWRAWSRERSAALG